ncbi:hypothetical protein [Kaarinaea lacus]
MMDVLNYGKWFLIINCGFVAACSSMSAKNWNQQRGQVVNSDSQQPVWGANIVAVWKGSVKQNGDKHSVCYNIIVENSDTQGHFTIPPFAETDDVRKIQDKTMKLVIYKPGFWSESINQVLDAKQQNKVYLEPVSDENRQTNGKQRLKYLQQVIGATGCNIQNDAKIKLHKMYNQIMAEAEQAAQTKEDWKKVKSMKNWTEFVAQ